jgi:lysophospholipase L1-like esterase
VLASVAFGSSTASAAPSSELAASRSAAAAAGLQNAEYVALGDSYAAGYGLSDPTGKPVPACGQSKHDYPHQIAKALDLHLTDVSCAGADSGNVVSYPQDGAAPQVDALSASTRLVTLTIGGNDADLFATASSCLALTATGPVFSGRDAPSCKSRLVHNGVDSLRASVNGPVRQGITSAIDAVKSAAPNADVIVIGYPAIFPSRAATPKHGCFRSALDLASLGGDFPANSFPFTNTDTRYLAGIQRDMDSVTRTVARQAGVTYVSLLKATEKRSACSTKRALVTGVTLTASDNLQKINLAVGALHPNSAGAAYMARRGEKAILAAVG